MNGCESTYRDEDGTLYECAGISCPISEWLGGVPRRHKAWAVDVEWSDAQAEPIPEQS